jgi:hypothetical protein
MVDIAELQARLYKLFQDIATTEMKVGSTMYTQVLNGYPGYGTWVLSDQGRLAVGYSGTAPYTAGATGGNKDKLLLAHSHTISLASGGAYSNTYTSGSNSATHTHSATSGNQSANHYHNYGITNLSNATTNGGRFVSSGTALATTSAGAHTHAGAASGGVSANHTHVFTYYRLYAHTHTVTYANTGETATNDNLPPYVVLYAYRRTA